MLDYNKLRKDFTQTLQAFDHGKLMEWVIYDLNRTVSEQIFEGKISYSTIGINKLSDPREVISNKGNNNYILAA